MKFKAKWLPGGEVELAALPLKGDRELKAIAMKDAEIEAVFTQFKYISLAQALLAAEKVCNAMGDAKAKESWDDYIALEFRGIPEFVWPVEEFRQNILATKARIINQQLACGTDEEARMKLDEMAKATGEAAKAIDREAIDRIAQRPLLSLYWRLRASGVKQVITIGGPVDIPWKADPAADKAAILDLLAGVVSNEDLEALDQRPKDRPLDMTEFKPLTAADVEGKSETPSMSSTASSPATPPSSTTSDGPGKPQETPSQSPG